MHLLTSVDMAGADTATLTINCVLAGSRDLKHRVVATLYENPLQLSTLQEIIVELFGFGEKSTFKLMYTIITNLIIMMHLQSMRLPGLSSTEHCCFCDCHYYDIRMVSHRLLLVTSHLTCSW